MKRFDDWISIRRLWAEDELKFEKTRDLFSELYNVSVELQRESETYELIAADGFIRDRDNSKLDHPVLIKRINIQHDAENNIISLLDTDVDTNLYTVMLQNISDINLGSITQLREDLYVNNYHPFSRNDTTPFFRTFIHQLSSESSYFENGCPKNWEAENRIILYRNPCFILRKRQNGALQAIEKIIEHVEQTGNVPAPIVDIVEGGEMEISEEVETPSIDEQLAAVGGESVDILLSKEANKEQLEIARRIDRYNAVLVQGPPGTGKTHTIANLMGHFLAQGKTVLVTSEKQKALSVLKDKVVPGLQNLCVSVLDDSNSDMEKSIDGITSYMARTTSYEVKEEMETIGRQRKEIIEKLANVRKKLFAIINQECNCIVYNGEEISPSEAAKFVQDHNDKRSYIPGSVKLYEPLPLTRAELIELYQSNRNITVEDEDEDELQCDLPDPSSLLSPQDFKRICNDLGTLNDSLQSLAKQHDLVIENRVASQEVAIEGPFGKLVLTYPTEEELKDLVSDLSAFEKPEPWRKYCAADGKKGDKHRQLWVQLVEQIEKTCDYADDLVASTFGKEIVILDNSNDFREAIRELKNRYASGKKISKLATAFNKKLKTAQDGATIDGHAPTTENECSLIEKVIEMEVIRNQCAKYWDELMAKHGAPAFWDLDTKEPERVAANYILGINETLNWYENAYEQLIMHMQTIGLSEQRLFNYETVDSDIVKTEKILLGIQTVIPVICDALKTCKLINEKVCSLGATTEELKNGKRMSSIECDALVMAIDNLDSENYGKSFKALQVTFGKNSVQQKRNEYLDKIAAVAPQWAEAIRNRTGIHGEQMVPEDIEEAWCWKQYHAIIDELLKDPFAELQNQALELSNEYRRATAVYAEKSSWYHLLKKTEHDIDMKQALQGWKLTVKKIGKGTGKHAPYYRRKARELMGKCQEAVPAWIMPINKALESLDPSINKFDVVIIDEASQSDISSLAILYMGKKLIVVGDDKQVSPMAIGVEVGKINDLKAMYLENKIPNAHLYDAKTSLYDIAATTFQPLMLREHFRCAPEIISFSNWLSYDNKIKPLRDCSESLITPAVVNYRAENAETIGKVNRAEVQAIVALIKACIEQPEYAGKTFGVISLKGDDQVKAIQAEIFKEIEPKVCNERRILCGNASNFQGDERDVIFLSLVDSCSDGEILRLHGFGTDDANRKRYNVAVSRAKDQLWVVHSLDASNNLKPGDIRKMLLDFAANPRSISDINRKIEEKSESPFEAEVARYLALRGYKIVQQWEVGAYRLDMVVVGAKKKIAIECDGERFHSSEDQIRNDMERQTILERLGWRFIRIRGSEYYRDPDGTMERIIQLLKEADIEPETGSHESLSKPQETELLQRVKLGAFKILQDKKNKIEI